MFTEDMQIHGILWETAPRKESQGYVKWRQDFFQLESLHPPQITCTISTQRGHYTRNKCWVYGLCNASRSHLIFKLHCSDTSELQAQILDLNFLFGSAAANRKLFNLPHKQSCYAVLEPILSPVCQYYPNFNVGLVQSRCQSYWCTEDGIKKVEEDL